MPLRIAITGLGLITPLGDDPQGVFDALRSGRRARVAEPSLRAVGIKCGAAARVERASFAPGASADALLSGPAMGLAAARAAMRDAGRPEPMGAGGLFVNALYGAPCGWWPEFPDGGTRDAAHAAAALADGLAERVSAVARALHAEGPVVALQASCAGNAVFATALDHLREGTVPWALAGGFEEIQFGVLAAFDRVRALSDACKPFDRHRLGTVIGEGAAFVHLEPLEAARERGVRVYAELLAVGDANDAFDLVAPDEQGEGAVLAIRRALSLAGLEASEVDAVNAHGTGTLLNDAAEARALLRTLGDPKSRAWRLNSTKGALGHAMGAASPIEAVLNTLSVAHGVFPPTAGLEEIDETLGVAEALQFSQTSPRVDVVMSNGFGFGGHDAVALFARPGRGAPVVTRRPVYVAGGSLLAAGLTGLDAVTARIADAAPFAPEREARWSGGLGASFNEKDLRHLDRHTELLAAAFATLPGGWSPLDRDRAGVVVGAAYPGFNGGMAILRRIANGGPSRIFPLSVPHGTPYASASWLAIRRGVRGLNLTVASHRCAGLDALALASAYLRADRAQDVLVGGLNAPGPPLDATLAALGVRGLSEAAAILCLSAEGTDAWAEVALHRQGFGRGALARCLEGIAAVDVFVGPPEIPCDAPRRLDLRPVLGDTLGAEGAIGALWAAGEIRAGRCRRALVAQASPLGWSSVMLLTCPTR